MAKYKKCNWKSSREERRTNAETLATERAERTDAQQLKLLNKRPGSSVKERAKIAARKGS